MDLSQIGPDIKGFFDHILGEGKRIAEETLPEAIRVVEAARANPLAAAALQVMHLSPDVLASFADALIRADNALGEAKAAQAAAEAAAQPPAAESAS